MPSLCNQLSLIVFRNDLLRSPKYCISPHEHYTSIVRSLVNTDSENIARFWLPGESPDDLIVKRFSIEGLCDTLIGHCELK